MRDAFLHALGELAAEDRNVVLLSADLGFGVFEGFEARFPGQYFNVGVAEQNMTGIATGLALAGKRVVTYSIGNFPTLRCLEQIRNDACYHDANLTVVASGGGFSYGPLGMSHHATEDLAILRALPGMIVVAPGTVPEAGEATRALVRRGGVGYLRIDKSAAPDPGLDSFSIGQARRLRDGRDITLLATGGILLEALQAAERLAEEGIQCRILSCHTVKPLDVEAILDACRQTGGLLTLEEHNILGGLGSAVAETCMDHGVMPCAFRRMGLGDRYSSIVGSQGYLRSRFGLDAQAVVRTVRDMLATAPRR